MKIIAESGCFVTIESGMD